MLFKLRFLWFCLFKPAVYVAVDVSGSIAPAWLRHIDGMLRFAYKWLGVRMLVMLFDTEIVSVLPYNPVTGLELDTVMGGGSDCQPVIDFANSIHNHALTMATGLVIFTDGYVGALQAPRLTWVPTLWAISPDGAKLDKTYPGKAIYAS